MTRLKPPVKMLEEIAHKETKIGLYRSQRGIRIKMELPTFPDKRYYRFVTGMFIGALKTYFTEKLFMTGGDIDGAFLNHVILGVLHNAAKHGNKNDSQKKITMGWWFGERGILIGIRDEGEFFLKLSVKKLIESRAPISSPGKKYSDLSIIYDADSIQASEGALFITLLFNSVVLPKN